MLKLPPIYHWPWRSMLLSGMLLVAVVAGPYQSHAEIYSISGYSEATHDATLGVVSSGRVAKLLVKAGDSVKAQQSLLVLEQTTEKLETQRRKLLWESQTEITAVSRQLKTLQAHLISSQQLYRSSASISQEDLENQQLEAALTEIELNRLQVAEEREQLEYQIARQQLKEKTIKAPFSGQIVEVLVTVGENCDIDTPLLRIVDGRQLEFIASVELALSHQLQLAQEVELLFESGQKTQMLSGKISFISPVVDPASGLRKIKVGFSNQALTITPGEPGTMQFETTAP